MQSFSGVLWESAFLLCPLGLCSLWSWTHPGRQSIIEQSETWNHLRNLATIYWSGSCPWNSDLLCLGGDLEFVHVCVCVSVCLHVCVHSHVNVHRKARIYIRCLRLLLLILFLETESLTEAGTCCFGYSDSMFLRPTCLSPEIQTYSECWERLLISPCVYPHISSMCVLLSPFLLPKHCWLKWSQTPN